MADFKTAFIAALERAVPELKGKVQAGAVDAAGRAGDVVLGGIRQYRM